MANQPGVPELPDDDRLRTAIVQLVGAASYYRAALHDLMNDPTAVSSDDQLEFDEAHGANLKKADGILKAWAGALGLRPEPGDPFPS